MDEYASEWIYGNWAFEDYEPLFPDPLGLPAQTGETPPYVLSLLKPYPDFIEGGCIDARNGTYIRSVKGVGRQKFMVTVADKRACQTGAVLLIGFNDFAQMVPQRLRVKAGNIDTFCATWHNEQGLSFFLSTRD